MAETGPDRRRFLTMLGLGGAGLAGAAVFGGRVPAARAATTDAISLGNRMNQLVVAARGSGFDWAEQCQRGQYYAEWAARGSEAGLIGYATARAAYAASAIVSTDMTSAPAGSFSYFDRSADGHVVTNIGNGYCINTSPLMSGSSVHDFGRDLRITTLAAYPAPYLGWSYGNGANPQIDLAPWSPGGGGAAWAFNPPVASVQQRIQAALSRRGRYSGPIDGVWGVNSIKGIQTTAANVGYTGPVNGIPGERTCHYVQVYANRFGGYAGPIDSILGPNSWEGFARGLEAPLGLTRPQR